MAFTLDDLNRTLADKDLGTFKERQAAAALEEETDAELELELKVLTEALDIKDWEEFPEKWVADRTGEFLWSKQVEICRSVAMYKKTAVPSCFASGKSFLAARLVA